MAAQPGVDGLMVALGVFYERVLGFHYLARDLLVLPLEPVVAVLGDMHRRLEFGALLLLLLPAASRGPSVALAVVWQRLSVRGLGLGHILVISGLGFGAGAGAGARGGLGGVVVAGVVVLTPLRGRRRRGLAFAGTGDI